MTINKIYEKKDISNRNPKFYTFSEAMKKAADAYNQGNWRSAEKICRLILKNKPDYSNALRLLGFITTKTNRLNESFQILKKAIEINPQSADNYLNLGDIYLKKNRYEAAIKEYDNSISHRPKFTQAYINKAICLQKLKKFNDALVNYDVAIQINPNFAEAFSNKGVIYHHLGKLNDAEQSYIDALKIKKEYVEAYYNLGLVQKDLFNFDSALLNFDKAIEKKGNFSDAYLKKGDIYEQQKKYNLALESYNKALEINPNLSQAYSNRGFIFQKLKLYKDALSDYDKALSLNPHLSEVYNNRGNVLRDLSEFDLAIDSYNRALTIDPDSPNIYFNKGFVLYNIKSLKSALFNFQRAIDLKSNYAEAYYYQGNIHRELNNHKLALESYDKAILINPLFAKAYNKKGLLLIDLYDITSSLKCFDKALSINEKLYEVIFNKASAFIMNDNIIEGFNEFTKYAKLTINENEDKKKSVFNFFDLKQGEPHHKSSFQLKHDEEQTNFFLKNFDRLTKNEFEKNLFLYEGKVTSPTVNKNNLNKTIFEWNENNPKVIVVDNFLTNEALIELRKFCLFSNIWKESCPNGYLGTFPEHGFSSSLLARISIDLKNIYSMIFEKLIMKNLWGLKYDSKYLGKKLFAYDAEVSVKFWITPDEANLNANSGGLIVWNEAFSKNCKFENCNDNFSSMREALKSKSSKKIKIPYKSNRAVIFKSDLLHETDDINFKEGYFNNKIEVTLLYGKAKNNTTNST